MTRPNYIDYENILKCGKCATEHVEIHKSFSLWCIIVNFFFPHGIIFELLKSFLFFFSSWHD